MRISDWSSDVCSSDLNATAMRDDHPLDAAEIGQLPRRANQILFAVLLDVAGADVGVVRFERLDDIFKAQAIGQQLRRVGRDVELLLVAADGVDLRSEEHTSELQSLMRISYAVFCLK